MVESHAVKIAKEREKSTSNLKGDVFFFAAQ
jgi:hypothetical protein